MLNGMTIGLNLRQQFTMSSDQQLLDVARAVWEAQPTQLAVTDRITVRNLQASVDAGVDVWNRPKKQRALITVTLSLAKSFSSAAQADALDNSTVHYGKLSKALQAHIGTMTEHDSSWTLAAKLGRVAQGLAADTPLASIEVDIFYPKGSMFGDGAGCSIGYMLSTNSSGQFVGYQQLYLRNVRIPCLIGVNANERQQKQPVVVNIWIDRLSPHRDDDYQRLETVVVDVRQYPCYLPGC